jgi:hypothetical protein
MIPRNFERREKIKELWLQDYTVDEISSQTGIPRSSVGYYFAKFNKSKNGDNPRSKPPVKPKRLSNAELILRRIGWIDYTTKWSRLMADERYQDAKNMVESTLLYNRLQRETMYHVEGEEDITNDEQLSIAFGIYQLKSAIQSTLEAQKKITYKEIRDLIYAIGGQQQNSQSPK